MINAQKSIIKRGAAMLGIAALLCFAPARLLATPVDLAQEPLFVTAGVSPNVMFILDDSGSMHFEFVPEEEFRFGTDSESTRFVYPRATSAIYGGSEGDANVATFASASISNARARSPQINQIYYDPGVTYLPWVKHDGTLYPNAQKDKAYHNPEVPSKGFRDLTTSNSSTDAGDTSVATSVARWRSCTGPSSGECSSSATTQTFWPALYYWYTGAAGEEWDQSKYDLVEIKPTTLTYSGHGRENRTDCLANGNVGVCTYAEEIQNFANWYSYYRSRILTARAGIGRAFSEQGSGIRVGFGKINQGSHPVDGQSTSTVIKGVRAFEGTDRQEFFDTLYGTVIPNSGTPLRQGLDGVGQYFSRTDNRGPYGKTPGTDDAEAHLACRANYAILMTDGYWKGGDPSTAGAAANNDGTNGSVITGPNGQSYQYTPRHPFADNESKTLADVAMYYWKNDLRTNLDNKLLVPDPDPSVVINPAFWQHMVTYGVALGVEGTIDPQTAFDAILDPSGNAFTWPAPSSGATTANVDDLLHAGVNSYGGFFSAADPASFAEELSGILNKIAKPTKGSSSTVAANSTRLGTDTAIFQASFNTDGWTGEINAWNLSSDGSVGTQRWTSDGKIDPSNHASRDVFTYNGSTGLEFNTTNWAQLTQAQQEALMGEPIATGDVTLGQARINWVRGKNDITGLRVRPTVGGEVQMLGDIVNSSPVLASNRDFRFDSLSDALGGLDYKDYVDTVKTGRTEVLYVGANDGMLHAFDANTGEELFAYVPSGVYEQLTNLSNVDYGKTGAPHKYSVDGPLFIGDAYFTHGSVTKWRNILVGTLGAGGKGLYVLDVSDPSSFGPEDVLFEITDADFPAMGHVVGQPLVAPTNDGWKIIVGNGYNSSGTLAQLFAIDLSNPTGSDTEVIDTESGPGNGMSAPSLLMNGAGEVESVYAGDLLGQMWKFDFSGNSWGSVYKSGNTPAPLFTARDGSNKVQPITAAPTLGLNAEMGNAVMVYFGTGKYISSNDNLAGDTVQSFYAIADQGSKITATNRSTLMEKTIDSQSATRLIGKDEETTWWAQDGWYLDFHYGSSTTGERVISKPLLIYDRLLFPTLIPSSDPCSAGSSGWLMELTAVGDRYPGHSILGEDGLYMEHAVMGISDFIRGGENVYIPTSNIKGEIDVKKGDLPDASVGRMSWRQLR